MDAPLAVGIGAGRADGKLNAVQHDRRPSLIAAGCEGSHENPLLSPRASHHEDRALACGSRNRTPEPLVNDTNSRHGPIVLQRGTLALMVRTHGSGKVERSAIALCPESVVIEPGALIFHPENLEFGEEVYIGHYAILKAYYQNKMIIGARSWIGQGAFLHSAGGITIGARVGIGPGAKIISSHHQRPSDPEIPIMEGELHFAPVVLEDGCDIGVGAIILPGVRVGKGAQVGAGAVVTRDVAPGATVKGVPAT